MSPASHQHFFFVDRIWAWSVCPSKCRPFLHPISFLPCQSLSGPGFCLRGHLSVSRPLSKCCSGSHFPSLGASTRTSEDNLVLPWKSCYTLNLPSSALPREIEKKFFEEAAYIFCFIFPGYYTSFSRSMCAVLKDIMAVFPFHPSQKPPKGKGVPFVRRAIRVPVGVGSL